MGNDSININIGGIKEGFNKSKKFFGQKKVLNILLIVLFLTILITGSWIMTVLDLSCFESLKPVFEYVTGASLLFLFVWIFVGSFSLWQKGGDCQSLNPPIWNTGMAIVISSILMFVFSGVIFKIEKDENKKTTQN